MKSVLKTLKDTDAALYPILAKRWNVNITKAADAEEITQLLSDAMLDPARVEKAWESLDDRQRGALQSFWVLAGKCQPSSLSDYLAKSARWARRRLNAKSPMKIR
jgi:hypothetical protein